MKNKIKLATLYIRQGLGWQMLKELVNKLKAKADKEGQAVLLSMHLRESSFSFMSKYQEELARLGVRLISENFEADYYEEGDEDAIYQVYEVK